MTQKQLIGMTGPAGAGKDTAAAALIARLAFSQYAFAGPLKVAAGAIFGFSDDQLYGHLKEAIDPYWGTTPRSVLQRMGTDAMRTVFGADVWLRVAERQIEHGIKNHLVVISDVRFNNEAEFVRRMGGTVIHVERPDFSPLSDAAKQHVSESGVTRHDEDIVLLNRGSVEEFSNLVVSAVVQRIANRV